MIATAPNPLHHLPLQTMLQKLRPCHEVLIDALVSNPSISRTQLAAAAGYTPEYITLIMKSDAFKEAYAKVRERIVDPLLAQSVEQRMTNIASLAQDRVMDHLTNSPDPKFALAALNAVSPYAAASKNQASVINYIIQLPAVAKNSSEWLEQNTKTIEN